jgi:hypothetical protein
MTTNRSRWICGCVVLLAIGSTVQSQQDTSSKPLGDVAREQQARKQQKQNYSVKFYSAFGTPSEKNNLQTNFLTAKPQSTETAEPVRRSVFDQSKSTLPDFIIVPAGTEIRVDIIDGKVIVPVRVGFATPVPALSQAAVKVNQIYYTPVSYNVGPGPSLPVSYGESAELTAVTVGGVTYPVQARPVSLTGAALGTMTSLSSSRDAVFVLTAPLAIER